MQAESSFREQGLSSLRQGDAASAARALSHAVRVDPADAEAWSALGVALCKLGQLAEGVPALQRAVALRPGAAPLQFNLGRALELRKQFPEALECYRQALKLDPTHTGAVEAMRRLDGVVAGPASPTLGDFILADASPVIAAPVSVTPQPPFRPQSQPGPQPTTPYSGYPPPAGPIYVGPNHSHRGVQPPRTGTSPWVVIGAIFGGLLVMGGAFVLILAAILLPAVQRAREAAVRVERQQRENAWRTMPGSRPPVPQFSPPVAGARLRTAPNVLPPPSVAMPQTRIVVPRMQPVVIPEPPRFTPPPVPEPPHFSPSSIPVPEPPRPYFPRTIPGGGAPRFRYGPPGMGAPEAPVPQTSPDGAPSGAARDGMAPSLPGSQPAQ